MTEVEKYEEPDDEESIAVLVHPDEFKKNPNQVASLTDKRIKYIRGKTLAMNPFEIEYYPIEKCNRIKYEKKFAVLPMIFGVFCILIVGLVMISPIPGGTRVPVGALALALGLGVILVRGIKRHKLTFEFDSKDLKWQSKAGDFKHKHQAVQNITEFARKKALLVEI